MVVLLVLCSAFLHALWNALLRTAKDKDAAGPVVVTIAAVISAAVAAVTCFATGAPAFTDGPSIAFAAAAGLFEAAYFQALVRALTAGPLGPVYTVSRGGAILAVWPVSVALFAEPITAFTLAGTLVLIAGLGLAGLQSTAPRRALLWACACAAFIAGYHLCYKRALLSGASPPAVFALSLAVATPINLWRLRGRLRSVGGAVLAAPLRYLGTGAICATSFLLFVVALRQSGAGLVLTLRNTSVLFATALGWAIGEPPGRRQLLGAALVAGGAGLLGLGH